jgi:hypothetical protein
MRFGQRREPGEVNEAERSIDGLGIGGHAPIIVQGASKRGRQRPMPAPAIDSPTVNQQGSAHAEVPFGRDAACVLDVVRSCHYAPALDVIPGRSAGRRCGCARTSCPSDPGALRVVTSRVVAPPPVSGVAR